MKAGKSGIDAEIERYLRTGDSDLLASAWPGDSLLERSRAAHRDLIAALVAEVKRRPEPTDLLVSLEDIDLVALTRRKTEPLVRGFFPRAEQPSVQALVDRSVRFLAPHTIEEALETCPFLNSAWKVANLYLGALGAPLLGKTAPEIVGLSVNCICYVSPAYFEEDLPFGEFVVHEVAHVLHDCKPQFAGLPETRRRERLVEVDFRRREEFAYSCEVFARILERSSCRRDRLALAEEFAADPCIPDAQVDPEEVADIVLQAAGGRNGWKTIVARCAPPKRSGSGTHHEGNGR